MKYFKTFENFMSETTDPAKDLEAKRLERQHRLERIIGEEDETCDMSEWKDYVPVKDEPVKEAFKDDYFATGVGNWSVKYSQETETYHAYDLQSGTTSITEEQLKEELESAFRDRYNQEPVIDSEKVIIKEPWKDYEPEEVAFFTRIVNFLTMNSFKNWLSEFFKSKTKVEKPVREKKSFLYSIKMWFYE